MAIGFIELNGTIQRTQDFTSLKHQQDTKAMVEQSTIQVKSNKDIINNQSKVIESGNTAKNDTHADAREKGKNEYQGDGGKNRYSKTNQVDGIVMKKKEKHFDISI